MEEVVRGPLLSTALGAIETPASIEERRFILRARLITDDFDLRDGMCAFEITAGDSSLVPWIARDFNDISMVSLDIGSIAATGDRRVVSDLPALVPLKRRSYDRGMAYLALARVDRRIAREVLRDVSEVLAPGGRFRFAMPDSEELQTRSDSEPLACFCRDEVFELVESLDYQVVSMRRFDPDGPYWQEGLGTHFLFDVRKLDRQ